MKPYLNGWRLTGLISALLTIVVLLIVGSGDYSTDSIRLAIRVTARTSLILFLPVFMASALVKFWPGGFTRWLLRNRRYLGVSFAASHGLHAIVIIAFAIQDPVLFGEMTTMGSIISGSSAYLFIVLMAATSFDAAMRALGSRNWRILHWVGAWYIAISFIFTNLKRTPDMPLYWLPVALVVLAIIIRLAGWWRDRRATRVVPASA